ncbi:hypothetical protein PAEPH01_0974 [Pancytospora epiphaga]|nr:hypothetical protein PAEPH01_0974 [Pancytospora epiphaga]
MSRFFTNVENSPCVEQESISLNDCLACSGCVTPDEAATFAPDLSFLHVSGISPIFIISPQSKRSIYSHFRNHFKDLSYSTFESSFIFYLHEEFYSPLILDTSYFSKTGDVSGQISSECPAVVLYIERVFPSLLPLLSKEFTYQQLAVDYAQRWIARFDDERRNTQLTGHSQKSYKIVSIMHCYDKKDENGRDSTNIDYFIGAKDLFNIAKDKINLNVDYKPTEEEMDHGYPDQEISGRENVINILKKIRSGVLSSSSIPSELRICNGGCLMGPAQVTVDNPEYTLAPTSSIENRINTGKHQRVFRTQKKRTFNVEW